MIIQNIHLPHAGTSPVWLSPSRKNEGDDHSSQTLTKGSGFTPKRVLGFDPSLGRGFVYSTDQTQEGHPEFLFLDTPGDPDLQLICSMIITRHSDDTSTIFHRSRTLDDAVAICEEEVAKHLTLNFVSRYFNPNCPDDLPLKQLLEEVYFEGKKLPHGIIVMIPAMHHHHCNADDQAGLAKLWGSGGYDFPNDLTKGSLDIWIELVCIDYYSASLF
jgi:hypothetical protein